MRTLKKNSGFTLIELMIVVAIIAIIASVAIPRLMAARLSANESAAISTLRSLTSAQAQVQSSGAIDTDGDGAGEYGSFGELSGVVPCRVSAAGAAAAGAAGTDELNPAVLSAAFGNVAASLVTRSGYNFQIYLPTVTTNAPMAEDATGGFAATFPGSNEGEVMWCCYAWPVNFSQTGNRTFFVNQAGDIYQYNNKGTNVYSGATAPAGDAIFQAANDMGSPVCNVAAVGGAVLGQDGENWVPVQ